MEQTSPTVSYGNVSEFYKEKRSEEKGWTAPPPKKKEVIWRTLPKKIQLCFTKFQQLWIADKKVKWRDRGDCGRVDVIFWQLHGMTCTWGNRWYLQFYLVYVICKIISLHPSDLHISKAIIYILGRSIKRLNYFPFIFLASAQLTWTSVPGEDIRNHIRMNVINKQTTQPMSTNIT